MEGYSISDVMALTSRNEGSGFSFGGIGGLILILLFFIIFGNSFGGFGRNNETNAISDLERDVLNGNATTQKAVLESNYNNLLSFKDAQYQLSQCCCNLEKTIMAEGQATRALIENNTIQELRDRLNVANNALTVQTIVNGVVNEVRPVAKPTYLTCSPYTSYNYNGNCGFNGTIF
jgi:hypothetical protein